MKRSFSFTEKPILFILRELPFIIPGIDKVITIYFDPDLNNISSCALQRVSQEYILEEIRVNDVNPQLQKFRNDSSPFSWVQRNDIPFEIKSNQKVQISIFNELDNNILLIRIKNAFDSLHDLFFIYLNQNLSNFGIVNSSKPLSTESKSVIGHLVFNTIQAFLANSREDKELFSVLQDNNNMVIQQMNKFKSELLTARERFRNGIVHLCRMYLNELSMEHHKTYRFSDDAIDKLKEFNGDLGFLKPILEKAARFAESMQYENDKNIIEIFDYHLILNEVKEIIKQQPNTLKDETIEIPIRYNKTLLLLNKLETAANNLKVKNKLLTSANVANEFPSPVSPSAITDALKKHRPKILHLFKEFPGRWVVIRNEFRPVQNILNPKQERQKNTA